MNRLQELLQKRDAFLQDPNFLAANPMVLPCINDLIASEQRKAQEVDPVLEAKIQAWILEGRIIENAQGIGGCPNV